MPTRETIKMRPRKAATPAVREPGMTAEQKGRFLEVFEDTLSVKEAAEEADVTADELRAALREDKEFREAKKWIVLGEGEKVQKAMIDRARKGDPACARVVLPVLMPEVYGNQITIDINVNSPDDLKSVGDEKLQEIKAACLKLQNS